jgi:CHAD domain-containing protein
MPYRFKPTQRLDKSFRRVGLEQIDHALARLASKTGDHAVDVHETRKCMKRLRALLRIARPSLGEVAFKRENARFRDIAQLLAATRDRHVLLETLVKLQAACRTDDAHLVAALARARTALDADSEQMVVPPASERKARTALVGARRKIERIALSGRGFDTIEGGLRRTYADARKALPEAYRIGTDAAFHELRKHVQHHWRHMLLLSRVWPAEFAARAAAARELSQALGDDHDLAVLAEFLVRLPPSRMPRAEARLVAAAARERQQELRARAHLVGNQLLAEEPRDFTRRIAAYWRTARRHTRRRVPHDDARGETAGAVVPAVESGAPGPSGAPPSPPHADASAKPARAKTRGRASAKS